MVERRKFLGRLTVTLPLIATACLIFSVALLFRHKESISFNQVIKTPDQIHLDALIEKGLRILRTNDEITKKAGIRSRNMAIERYNDVSKDFNSLTAEVNASPLLKENIVLRRLLIEANNDALSFLEQTRIFLDSSPRLPRPKADTEQFVKRYENLKSHPSLKQVTYQSFNEMTLLFLSGLTGFSFFTILYFILSTLAGKSANALLMQKESELKTFLSVIDNMSEGVIVSDRLGFFTYYNKAATDIVGPHVRDIYYQSSLDLIGFHDVNGTRLLKADSPFHKAFKKDIVTDQEILIKNNLHDGIFISASNGYYVDQKGDTLGAVVVMKNITHKKQLEELWKKEKETAIEGSRKKSDFLATMSHEIRTPMNGIIGLTTLLSESSLNDQQSEFVQIIRRSAYALLALINDILDHAKIESGKIEIIPVNFDLKFLIKDVVENFKFSCIEKNNEIKVLYPEALEKFYVADENRVRQILINLIGNAVKFTVNGGITIKVDLTKSKDSLRTLKFSIIDTGPGMDQHELDRLFQRFFQTTTGIRFGGTGLGLSICKQLVTLMQGTIGVESQPGLGSTFWFELSFSQGTEQIKPAQARFADFDGTFRGHILVAEDNVINQKVILHYLSKLGFTMDLARNGQEAVELFKRRQYDIVLMDCNMPLLNGYEATKKINSYQKEVNSSREVQIIALSAEGQAGGRARCLEAGMSDFISKPILIEELVATLKKHGLEATSAQTNALPLKKARAIEHNVSRNQSVAEQTSAAAGARSAAADFEILNKLSDLKSGDRWLMDVLFEDYLNSVPPMLQQMQVHLESQNIENLSDLAHTLKSISGTLGASSVRDVCQQIEDLAGTDINGTLGLRLAELGLAFQDSVPLIQLEIDKIKNLNKKAAA